MISSVCWFVYSSYQNFSSVFVAWMKWIYYLLILCVHTYTYIHTYVFVMYTPCYLDVVCVLRAHISAHDWCRFRGCGQLSFSDIGTFVFMKEMFLLLIWWDWQKVNFRDSPGTSLTILGLQACSGFVLLCIFWGFFTLNSMLAWLALGDWAPQKSWICISVGFALLAFFMSKDCL